MLTAHCWCKLCSIQEDKDKDVISFTIFKLNDEMTWFFSNQTTSWVAIGRLSIWMKENCHWALLKCLFLVPRWSYLVAWQTSATPVTWMPQCSVCALCPSSKLLSGGAFFYFPLRILFMIKKVFFSVPSWDNAACCCDTGFCVNAALLQPGWSLVFPQVFWCSEIFRSKCTISVYHSRYKRLLIWSVYLCYRVLHLNSLWTFICIASPAWLVWDHGQDLIEPPAHYFAAVPSHGFPAVCREGRSGTVPAAGEACYKLMHMFSI